MSSRQIFKIGEHEKEIDMSNEKDTERLIGFSAYITGMLHAELIMIRNDLHMADTKAALAKVNDAIKLIDEKVAELFYTEKTHAEQNN